MNPLLEMRGIRKSFAGVTVLHGVDLTLNAGETLALLGGNGAGKSTLIKILNGDYTRDAGTVSIDGSLCDFRCPADAEAAGVRVIYQELNYAPDLSVAENVLLGNWPRKRGPVGRFQVDWRAVQSRAAELLAGLEADIDPRALMRHLTVGKQQMVEIAKALSRDARILVMDEPTAALTPREVSLLFATIERLRAQGVGTVFISHRLDEVEEIAQRVLVLRDGRVAGEREMKDVRRSEIVQLMVGRDIEAIYPARQETAGAPALQIDGLGKRGAFEGISMAACSGEIVGLFGLLGAGHEELVRAVFGAEPADSGTVSVEGRPVRLTSPQDARKAGIGFVPQDRKTDGLFSGMAVADNITVANWNAVASRGVFRGPTESDHARHWIDRLGIVLSAGPRQEAGKLSGGNQQKVVLGRWLEAGTRILLLAEPTRGVDIGARADIYRVLEELRERGLAIVLVSSDIEEVIAMSDRVLVFRNGRIAREFTREEATQVSVLSAAAGESTQ